MRRSMMLGALAAALLTTACDSLFDSSDPDRINMRDDCDPATFNAALGAGTCVGAGSTTFSVFNATLNATGSVPAWRFDPVELTVDEGTSLSVNNLGGEDHTFTEVEAFGGGEVEPLNQASGNPTEAPECVGQLSAGIIEPGAHITEDFDEAGDEKYQCCIHPWMRTVVHVHS
jgi:plastocyanin